MTDEPKQIQPVPKLVTSEESFEGLTPLEIAKRMQRLVDRLNAMSQEADKRGVFAVWSIDIQQSVSRGPDGFYGKLSAKFLSKEVLNVHG